MPLKPPPYSTPHAPKLFTPAPRLRPAQLEERLLLSAEKVLSDWAQLTPRRSGQATDQASADLWHVAVDLEGPQQGLLNVSCKPRFGAMLAVAATGDPGAGSFSHEAVIELCQLLRETLLTEGLGQDGRDYLLQAARAVEAPELPEERPQAAVSLSVNGYALELRLWLR